MKAIKFFYRLCICISLASALFACKNEVKKTAIIKKHQKPFNTNIIHEVIIDTNLLASQKDLVCYMPLWTGIGDTCLYKGKIYGFCSKDCKNDFLKNPAAFAIK